MVLQTPFPPITLAKPVSDWTMTPPSPAPCGVFRLYLLTSLPRVLRFLLSYRPFFSKPVDYGVLGTGFQSPIWRGFPGSQGRVCVGMCFGFLHHVGAVSNSL